MLLNCGVGEDSWESLDGKEMKPVNYKGNQSWIFIGRTDAKAEAPILRPPHAKNWLTGKDPDVRKGWSLEEKGTTKDEMVGWHHLLDGHEFEKAPGVGDRQGGLVCCSPWGHKESDMTVRLNWIERNTDWGYLLGVAVFIWGKLGTNQFRSKDKGKRVINLAMGYHIVLI